MKRFCALVLLACLGTRAHAQVSEVTIQEIQTVSAQDLGACVDTPQFLGETVMTRGTVVMDGGLAQVEGGRNLWLQSGSGPFSGIDLITTGGTVPVPGVDLLDLLAGDSIEVTGIVSSFGSETALVPTNINLIDALRPVAVQPVNLADLNDASAINLLPTGEQWEGVYVEINDVTVVSVNNFSASGVDRVNFDVRDAAGNTMTVSDRFLAQRLPGAGGTFSAPTVGTAFEALRGVVAHSANGCTGGSGSGYELYVFDASGFVVGAGGQAPQIASLQRSPTTPASSEDFAVTAMITDPDGSVASASVYYAIGVANNTYTEVSMADAGGGSFQGTIPASAYNDTDFIKYYVCATDNDARTGCNPNVPGGIEPSFFRVRDDGPTIVDVQFTPYANGNSAYKDIQLKVRGIVTASAEDGDLGSVYIQQPGEMAWAGLYLTGHSDLATLSVGDLVEVTGRVEESFGYTRLASISVVDTISSGNSLPDPIAVDPAVFTNYEFGTNEQYEGMLVRLQNPTGGSVFVVDANADDPNNFAEYRVGSTLTDAANGTRVVAGRQTVDLTSSLSFSFINDEAWISTNGIIDTTQVPVCVVSAGDSMLGLTGIVYFGFGNMKLLPRNNADVSAFSGANCPGGVGIEEETPNDIAFSAYPNPTLGRLHLDYAFGRPVRATAILFDLLGRTVASTELPGVTGNVSFDTRLLSAGTYLLILMTDDQPIEYRKVVVMK